MQKEQAAYETQLRQALVNKAMKKPTRDIEKQTSSYIEKTKANKRDDNYKRAIPDPTCCEILMWFLFCCCFCFRATF
jgi:methionine aminopeptidase